MNKAVRFDDLGAYRPITTRTAFFPEANSLSAATFSAKANLETILSGGLRVTPEDLEAAADALARMETAAPTPIDDWAEQLAMDIAAARD